jgi:hypothetical protein
VNLDNARLVPKLPAKIEEDEDREENVVDDKVLCGKGIEKACVTYVREYSTPRGEGQY